ncbi:hypothetical protein CLUG_03074 [Clavispora lusitaniae ATCC 42720]|uniref:triacylglycerol lipase n=1 Tax=Clavispora lusitaniae (strain ATCC 42720) TaxID=306902 RepID=C4Y3G1_CLAL4|nr:uncharacterized protein CLUG_03074 [Clavispora lusitaniae ATCC 42720]EEQ38948.1 hypothetical protein CLUG_03074 [Clavispora lusitaniae ATCC 42720]
MQCFLALVALSLISWAAAAPHPVRTDPDFSQLQWFARLASLAYCVRPWHEQTFMNTTHCPAEACSDSAFDTLQVNHVFDFSGFLEVGSGFIAVDHQEQTLFLVYKGTGSARDWVKNLNAFPVRYEPVVHSNPNFSPALGFDCEGCYIHKGFGTFTRTNGATILKKVQECISDYPDYRLVVAGHSLGGAMALMSAIELRLLGHDVLAVTLGAPRVGNSKFASFADKLFDTRAAAAHIDQNRSFTALRTALVRMVHRHDVVPMLPPGYKHSGYEYFLGEAGVNQTRESVTRGGLDYNTEAKYDFGRRFPTEYSTTDHVGYFYRVSTCKSS